jgi:hypothetical protein
MQREVSMAGLSSTQITNFKIAYQAFNLMACIPQGQSPLNSVLDPDVKVFDVKGDNPWKTQKRIHVVANFYALVKNGVGPTFDPYANGQPDFSTPNMAKGNKNQGNGAYWADTDGSKPDTLTYTFKFKGDLLAELHAR